ncbi:MAG: DNA polymerase ligase N-terminal domain-containing protein [Simkaniaceae bacterium]|nr:DNA polymerase ligase N-terminal domain-containing protein [Candidatus Sacchlamyda saccharinae]
MSLSPYRKRRKFTKTPEPKGAKKAPSKEPIFVVQKHYARSTHFDLRLEMGGVLKSWAVPKGFPKRIGEKHLAILTENHPMAYAKFEGIIPEGEYGAGKVVIWDKGTYSNVKTGSMAKCFKEGKIEFRAHGNKLKGTYALIHFKEKNWLLIKVRTKR